jgi:chromosome segregation ATPase
VPEPTVETSPSPAGLGWLQDQVYQLKAVAGALEQQISHVQAQLTQTTETLDGMHPSLRQALHGASQTPRIQEELNEAVALIVQLQDQQAEMNERLGRLTRVRETEEDHDQQEWTEVAKRTELLERQVASWQDRQAGVDEVGRRFQEGLSLVRQQAQQAEQRLEMVETRAARSLEGANRAEHTLTEVVAQIDDLRRTDDALAERLRATADVGHRLETTINDSVQELKRLELLAERIELHRAERQRLEDRALRLEEELAALHEQSDKAEDARARLAAHQQGLASRLESLHETVEEHRILLVDQIRKLTGTQERTKRHQIQELEREIREMKRYVADLAE